MLCYNAFFVCFLSFTVLYVLVHVEDLENYKDQNLYQQKHLSPAENTAPVSSPAFNFVTL